MSTDPTTLSLPSFRVEQLALLDAQGLIDLLHLHQDRLPRAVIDECARRGEAMIGPLAELIEDDAYWEETCDDDAWWALVHAVMILGLIPGERAGALLVSFMRRIDQAGDENLQALFDGCWPALFWNKPPALVAALRALALDRMLSGHARLQAVDCAIALAERQGLAALDAALDWAAGVAGDETEDWSVRLSVGGSILGFARGRHRRLLETLARRPHGCESVFTADDVAQVYAAGGRAAGWHDGADPWAFYAPDAIAERQQIREEEDAVDVSADVARLQAPYVRVRAKVGADDPCPCGSGKTYGECCLRDAGG